MPYLPFFAAAMEQCVFGQHPEFYFGSLAPSMSSLPLGLIYGHYHTISFGHATFDHALFAWLDLYDLGVDGAMLIAIAHEYVRHIVGDFVSKRMPILDAHSFGCPLQHRRIFVTETKE
jgi:hypothetical protein